MGEGWRKLKHTLLCVPSRKYGAFTFRTLSIKTYLEQCNTWNTCYCPYTQNENSNYRKPVHTLWDIDCDVSPSTCKFSIDQQERDIRGLLYFYGLLFSEHLQNFLISLLQLNCSKSVELISSSKREMFFVKGNRAIVNNVFLLPLPPTSRHGIQDKSELR